MFLTNDKYSFGSLHEMSELVSKLKPLSMERASEKEEGKSWDFGMGWERTKAIIANGGIWEEGAKNLDSVQLPESEASELAEQLRIEADVCGFAPIVPNALAGVPDSMMNALTAEVESKIIRVNVDMTISASVTSMELLNRGRAVLACIDALEDQGYSVELWAGMSTGHDKSDKTITAEICVKQAGEHYDVGKVAFCLCSVALFRRLFFRMIESHKHIHTCTSRAYGRCKSYVPTEGINVARIDYDDRRYRQENDALRTVKNIFANKLREAA